MYSTPSSLMLSKPARSEALTSARAIVLLAGLVIGLALYAIWCEAAHSFSKPNVRDPLAGALHGAVGPIPPPNSRPEAACPSQPQLLAVTGSTNEPLHRILQWIRYHQIVGFSVFYLFVEGSASDPAVVDVLRSLVGVKVFLPDDKLKWWHRRSRAHHENWLQKFFGQPCNGELFVKQSLNMEVAIHQARVDGVAWIGHIDTDELVHPAGSASYSMYELLEHVPTGAHALILPNYEALPEHDRVVDPSVETTLFKVAVDHIDKVVMQQNYRHIAHGNPNYFIAYSNGKSLARVEPGLRPHGAHRWASYNGSFQAYTHEQAAVLHYTYNRVSDLVSRRDRCECAPTQADVKRCFWLSFDQQAFIAAAVKTDEQLREMFNERLVWRDPHVIAQLRMRGLVQRIYAPQALIRQMPENIAEAVAWRSAERRAEDDLVRRTRAPLRRFSYVPTGTRFTCEQFLAEDSSINVLELMGDAPGEESTVDSDRYLIQQMQGYQQQLGGAALGA